MIKGIKHIFDPIFMINFYAVVGASEKQAKTIFKKIGIDLDTRGSAGRFLSTRLNGNETGIIWSQDKGVYLVHECLHAAVWALDIRGINITEDSDEVLAYYQGWLLRELRAK